MTDLRQEYVEAERAYEQVREQLRALLKDAGLKEHLHYIWLFVDDDGVLHLRGWNGVYVPDNDGIALLKKAGFDRGVLFETSTRKLFLDPTGAYVERSAKGGQ